MDHHEDFGTGQKKLGIYIFGVISCVILTLISFRVVMADKFTKSQIFTVIFIAAFIQFIVQVLCFLRLNTETEQGRINVLSILFTIVILISILAGSLWIMSNLNYNMLH